jgi:two-component system, OmpR family, sensor histidine kinase ArlS
MRIGTRIALQFTALVALILGIFSLSIYYLLESQTKLEFSKYLKDRALTTSALLIKEKNVDKKLLKFIDRNTLSSLYAAEVLVFNDENKIAYSNIEKDSVVYYSPELLERIRKESFVDTAYNEKAVVGLIYSDAKTKKEFLILAQSEDLYGKQKLENIKYAMTIGLISAILITIIAGFLFSNQALKPISKLNLEVSKITAQNLNKKLNTGNNNDEIATLARNFNEMLSRLEKSFKIQKSFVSNASHELRTPLAAIKSEIQIALEKERSAEEYQGILRSLDQDNSRLVKLTNGLLTLAKSEEGESNIRFEHLRIDEVIFEVQDEVTHQTPDYKVEIDFETLLDDERYLTINGNKALLKTLLGNIIDNACKYSSNHTAQVKIKLNKSNIIIKIKDEGIGINLEDQERIFEPFFRTQNASSVSGHGIGLSICKKIVESHKGRIVLKSEIDRGSIFSIILPHV